jgi:hypothetical protein
MTKIKYTPGDTVKYLSSKNEAKIGLVKSVSGNPGEQIIMLVDDSYVHEKQIIFRFDFRNLN